MSSVLYDAIGPRTQRRIRIGGAVGVVLLILLLAVAVQRLAANGQFEADKWEPFVEEPGLYTTVLYEGLLATLRAAVYALVLASVLGLLLGVGRLSRQPWIHYPAVVVIEFFRATPLLLLIFFFFLAFPIAFGINLPALWALVLGLTLYNGAVIAEIVRAGVLSLPRGQTEAALAVGLTRGQTMRLVLLPQAVRIMLPALVSQLVVLVKDTSLGFIVAYDDLLGRVGSAVQQLDNPIQLFAFAALVYILINSALSWLAHVLERRQARRFGARAVQATEAEVEPQG